MSEETSKTPQPNTAQHPAARLFAETVESMVTDPMLSPYLKTRVDDHARLIFIEYVHELASRAQGSTEHVVGQITTLFGNFLNFWDMGLAEIARRGGEFHAALRPLIVTTHSAPVAKTQQRH